MKGFKKLFSDIDLTWKKLIIFACAAGVYTGVMNLIPVFKDTSFSAIAVHFECWIIFALIIILNCKKPLEAVCKTFVFFLISQPLVYLTEAPFLGFRVFTYYPKWFIWTLLTIPMSYIAWFIKKKNTLSAIILSFAAGLLALEVITYLPSVISSFPHYLLSLIFCLFWIIFLPVLLFKTKKNRIITYVITLMMGCGIFFYTMYNEDNNYDVSNILEAEEGNWTYTIDQDNFSLEEDDGYLSISVHGKTDTTAYLQCINEDTGEEKIIKIIYQDGVITFEEE